MWKFAPILKTTIWGGNRIIPYKGLDTELSDVGESWEISGVPGSESVVEGGPDHGTRLSALIDRHGASLLGKRNFSKYGNNFPLLVKLIDSRSDLSVQVHPDDELAKTRGYVNGKSEMWYVLKADKGARIANGFRRDIDPSELDGLLERGELESELNYMDIHPGEVYYVPAGRVHAICSGAFVIEIQQNSDLTYRLYDYRRKDSQGKERELHVDLAREAIDYTRSDAGPIAYKPIEDVPVNVLRTPYFSVNVLTADTEFMRDYSESDTFVILSCTAGSAEIMCSSLSATLRRGDSLLIPASAPGVEIKPKEKTTLLETFIN